MTCWRWALLHPRLALTCFLLALLLSPLGYQMATRAYEVYLTEAKSNIAEVVVLSKPEGWHELRVRFAVPVSQRCVRERANFYYSMDEPRVHYTLPGNLSGDGFGPATGVTSVQLLPPWLRGDYVLVSRVAISCPVLFGLALHANEPPTYHDFHLGP